MESQFNEIKFTDDDVIEIDDWIPSGEYNPHNVRPWLLHDNGFVLCIVFASSLQDALDIAVDESKLDRFQVSEEDLKADYTFDTDSDGNRDYHGIAYLGNACESFDIESLGYIELPNPKRSWCATFNALQQKGKNNE